MVVSLLTCQQLYISVSTYLLQKSNDGGISLQKYRQRYITVRTYSLQKVQWRWSKPSDMPTTVHLIAHLPPTESPMTAELAFRHANDGTSQCPLTSYRKSNDGGISLPTCQRW